jgi:hypothetical protein
MKKRHAQGKSGGKRKEEEEGEEEEEEEGQRAESVGYTAAAV